MADLLEERVDVTVGPAAAAAAAAAGYTPAAAAGYTPAAAAAAAASYTPAAADAGLVCTAVVAVAAVGAATSHLQMSSGAVAYDFAIPETRAGVHRSGSEQAHPVRAAATSGYQLGPGQNLMPAEDVDFLLPVHRPQTADWLESPSGLEQTYQHPADIGHPWGRYDLVRTHYSPAHCQSACRTQC